MSPCKQSCSLRNLLRTIESKIAKLKETNYDLDDLLYHQPHRRQEVETKTAIVDSMLNNSQTEEEEIKTRIAHGCKNCNHE